MAVDRNRLVALSENTATIEMRTGARQFYRCRPSEPGRVLAWDWPSTRDDPVSQGGWRGRTLPLLGIEALFGQRVPGRSR
jgi:hypothetical protein